MEIDLLIGVFVGVAVLLFLILYVKIPAFISLLIASMVTGLLTGLNGDTLITTIKEGMGGTLGFVATVVGLGAMFGALLEHSGGAIVLANHLIAKTGKKNAPYGMAITGFIIAIPVFFDVAFIILAPVIYSLQKRNGGSLLLYAIPLLAGLAITHTFIPPTPGPVAVADILGIDLGWVMMMGLVVGIPTLMFSGIMFGRYIAKKIMVSAPEHMTFESETVNFPPLIDILLIIALPIFLILLGTTVKSFALLKEDSGLYHTIMLIGHPFSALIIANLVAWYQLGIKRGFKSKELLRISSKSMETAGTIILLTGAGGVFKQVLMDTGAGESLARSLTAAGLPIIVFGFLAAVLIRVIQGSSTVAMITAASIVAPLLVIHQQSDFKLAVIAIAIASGASIMSHVNDSGFWLVKQYLGLTEGETFRAWTVMTTIFALSGFLLSLVLYYTISL